MGIGDVGLEWSGLIWLKGHRPDDWVFSFWTVVADWWLGRPMKTVDSSFLRTIGRSLYGSADGSCFLGPSLLRLVSFFSWSSLISIMCISQICSKYLNKESKDRKDKCKMRKQTKMWWKYEQCKTKRQRNVKTQSLKPWKDKTYHYKYIIIRPKNLNFHKFRSSYFVKHQNTLYWRLSTFMQPRSWYFQVFFIFHSFSCYDFPYVILFIFSWRIVSSPYSGEWVRMIWMIGVWYLDV